MAVSCEQCPYSWSPEERISIQDQRQPLLTTLSFCVAKLFFFVFVFVFVCLFFNITGIEKASSKRCWKGGPRRVSLLFSKALYIVQFSSVAQLCPTLCDPMNRSTPGLPVHHQLLEFTQTHVHRVSDAIQPSHPVVPFSSCPQSLPASESLPVSQLFA